MGSGTVTPITTATGKAGKAINVGSFPWAIAVTPNGKTAYVANSGSGTVTPILRGARTASMTSDLQFPESGGDRHAARSYSLISPPRILRRRISGVARSAMAGVISAGSATTGCAECVSIDRVAVGHACFTGHSLG